MAGMATIFDGREYASRKTEKVKNRVEKLLKKGVKTTLASLFLPSDAGSALYTRIKGNAARGVGMDFQAHEIQDPKDTGDIITLIYELNENPSVTGILIQKPSGERDFSVQDWSNIVSALNVGKDVDGLHPENLGLLTLGTPRFIPATVKAVLEALAWGKVEVEGKHVVVLGASEILGKPLNAILTDHDATVTVVHKATRDVKKHTREADILVSATGHPGLITADMVKEGAAVIDVGAPKGDVRTEEVVSKVSFISPVPGGIGPVTVACLLENTVEATQELDG